MSPKFEFDDGFNIEIGGPVHIYPACGEGKNTNLYLTQGTPIRAVEEIIDGASQLRAVSLKAEEPSSNLIVNGEEKPSVLIPLGHDVVVHSS